MQKINYDPEQLHRYKYLALSSSTPDRKFELHIKLRRSSPSLHHKSPIQESKKMKSTFALTGLLSAMALVQAAPMEKRTPVSGYL